MSAMTWPGLWLSEEALIPKGTEICSPCSRPIILWRSAGVFAASMCSPAAAGGGSVLDGRCAPDPCRSRNSRRSAARRCPSDLPGRDLVEDAFQLFLGRLARGPPPAPPGHRWGNGIGGAPGTVRILIEVPAWID